jgi:hypothetical protein
MASESQTNNQQMIIYALVAIAVLLAAIVGFMIYNNMNANTASSTSSTTPPSSAAANSIAAGMPQQAQPVDFDPKTATKLPAGMTPEKALKTYMEDIKAEKWKDAFALLPLQQKNSYGTAEAYGQQVKGYGISGYKIGTPQSTGDEVQIVSEQDTPAMNITYTWTYTKVGKDWFVKSRAMGGAVQ